MRERILHHLERVVSFDTQNPPRQITADGGLFGYLRQSLGTAFRIEVVDHGEGCVSMLATRGNPRTMFNFHVDTVPAANGYTADPLKLRVKDGRAIGLGACDIKGATACMLAAAEVSDHDVALLFTSDEEAGSSTCVKEFCKRELPFDFVVVAEPTETRAITKHRGIVTATATFAGRAGHASSGNADRDSALHHLVRWASSALEFAASHEQRSVGDLRGIRFNLGRIEGGIKPNMIADSANVRFGFRPLPGDDGLALLQAFASLADSDAVITPGFLAPSLSCPIDPNGVETGPPVDFWTEAALFGAAGYDTVVLGPGNIAQAHTADEWVEIEQLLTVAELYRDGAPRPPDGGR